MPRPKKTLGKDLDADLKEQLPDILFKEPLAKYSTFKIGGSADYFYKLKNTAELPVIIQFFHGKKIPIFIFGGGSNILFDDKGFRGLIIKIETQNISIQNNQLTADAGVLISQIVLKLIKAGLTGLEAWEGLPGTVGGAVRGNAGCNGLEIKDVLVKATLLNPNTGEIHEVGHKYFEYKYRYGKLKDTGEILLNATFKIKERTFPIEKQKVILEKYRKLRVEKQPFGFTTGSFFKNPYPDKPAGMLIEKSGLKGKILGKAQISDKHANFFLNTGGASAKDIIELAKLAKRQVKAKFGIDLEEEVQLVGEKGPLKL